MGPHMQSLLNNQKQHKFLPKDSSLYKHLQSRDKPNINNFEDLSKKVFNNLSKCDENENLNFVSPESVNKTPPFNNLETTSFEAFSKNHTINYEKSSSSKNLKIRQTIASAIFEIVTNLFNKYIIKSFKRELKPSESEPINVIIQKNIFQAINYMHRFY